MKKNWKEEEIEYLEKFFSKKNTNDIVKVLNRSYKSIESKAIKLNLKKDINYLKNQRKETLIKRNKKIGRDLNKEFLLEIAKKYKTRSEFQEKDSSAYTTARIKGWLNDICSHMINKKFSIPQLMLKVFIDELITENNIYNDRKTIPPYEIDIYVPYYKLAFEYNGKVWHINNKNDDIKFKLLLDKKIDIIIINEDSRNYERDIKFQLIEKLSIINKNLVKKITKDDINNIDLSKAYEMILTHDQILEICKNYNNLNKFKNENSQIFYYLKKSNLLNEYTNHMIKNPHPICDKWKNEIDIISEINKYNNFKDFRNLSQGCYLHILKYNKKHLLKNFYDRIENDKIEKWNEKISLWKKTISKYKKLKDFREKDSRIYSRIIENKLYHLISDLKR